MGFKLSVRQRDIAAAIVFLLLTLGYGFLTARLPIRTLPNTPDPSFMPWIITALLGTLAGYLLISRLVAHRTEAGDKIPEPVANSRAGIFLAALFGFIVLLPVLGFIVAGIPFFALTMILFGERRTAWVLLGSIFGPVVLFAIFRHGFSIILPRGVMPILFG